MTDDLLPVDHPPHVQTSVESETEADGWKAESRARWLGRRNCSSGDFAAPNGTSAVSDAAYLKRSPWIALASSRVRRCGLAGAGHNRAGSLEVPPPLLTIRSLSLSVTRLDPFYYTTPSRAPPVSVARLCISERDRLAFFSLASYRPVTSLPHNIPYFQIRPALRQHRAFLTTSFWTPRNRPPNSSAHAPTRRHWHLERVDPGPFVTRINNPGGPCA